jgi:hypothetical protein
LPSARESISLDCLSLSLSSQEFTEAESNMNDLVSEYQQYQDATAEGNVPTVFNTFPPLTNRSLFSLLQKKVKAVRKKANTKVSKPVDRRKDTTVLSRFSSCVTVDSNIRPISLLVAASSIRCKISPVFLF